MGGRFALKGSDDPELLAAARVRGASPVAPPASRRSSALAGAGPGAASSSWPIPVRWGRPKHAPRGSSRRCVGSIGAVTTRADTRAAACAMAERGVDLLLFAGGDGTAVDVLEAIGDRVPVLGVPAGVKMHSAVFAVNPKSAGELALRFVDGAGRGVREAEVMDVDEALLRAGSVSARLHGYLNGAGGAPPRPGCEDEDARGRAGSSGRHREPPRRPRPRQAGRGSSGRARRREPCSARSGSRRRSSASTSIRDGRMLVADADEQSAARNRRRRGGRHRGHARGRPGVPVRARKPAALGAGARACRAGPDRGDRNGGQDRGPRRGSPARRHGRLRRSTRASPATCA